MAVIRWMSVKTIQLSGEKRADSDMPPVPRNGLALPIPFRRRAC
jgi:hypothetical protein